RLKIFNLSGGLVRDEEITKNHVTISSMDYASGLYFYQVFSENKLLKTEKFIIQ
ncbi:MAG: T9SS type A sorting domain-containing protein, partial [Altibacter sp.]|nr:T9SS type A sorting domain-containing protein [Altibacter sp.]